MNPNNQENQIKKFLYFHLCQSIINIVFKYTVIENLHTSLHQLFVSAVYYRHSYRHIQINCNTKYKVNINRIDFYHKDSDSIWFYFEKQVLYNINSNLRINLRNFNRNLNTSATNVFWILRINQMNHVQICIDVEETDYLMRFNERFFYNWLLQKLINQFKSYILWSIISIYINNI